jgi:hypothetical protein
VQQRRLRGSGDRFAAWAGKSNRYSEDMVRIFVNHATPAAQFSRAMAVGHETVSNVGAMEVGNVRIGELSRTGGGHVIPIEGSVHDRGAHLEHEVSASWRPTHLLFGAIRRCKMRCTALSVVAVEIGSDDRRAAA